MVDSTSDKVLLLVAGAGRSGTSTVTGSLARLGFAVPQPEVPADETNPRGFYEPQWVVDFHKRVLAQIMVRTNDARPEAVALAAEASARPELLDEVVAWLGPWAEQGQVVVKDPRTFWFEPLWRNAAEKTGLSVAFLTMLRHPAEVAKSRDKHYLADRDAEFRRARETTNVAAWCHCTLVTEALTRSDRRAFVLYPELMTDWRAAMRRADEQIGTTALADVSDAHHDVDDFIDVRLNRSQVGFDDLSVHPEIRQLAEAIWETCQVLVADPQDAAAIARMDELHAEYDRLYAFARDFTLDQTMVERDEHRKAMREQQQRFRRERNLLQERLRAVEASRAYRLARKLRGR